MKTKKSKKRQKLISNYGLFWHRGKVVWGSGGKGNQGHLKGRLARTGKEIDFRKQQGVYCLYDDNFRLIYVGQAGAKNGLFSRLKSHKKWELADRWTKFSWFGIRPVNKKSNNLRKEKGKTHPEIREVLNHIEAILIAAAEPPHNGQSGHFGRDVKQYFQYQDDDKLDPGTPRRLEDILDKLKKIENTLKNGSRRPRRRARA